MVEMSNKKIKTGYKFARRMATFLFGLGIIMLLIGVYTTSQSFLYVWRNSVDFEGLEGLRIRSLIMSLFVGSGWFLGGIYGIVFSQLLRITVDNADSNGEMLAIMKMQMNQNKTDEDIVSNKEDSISENIAD